MRRLSRFKDFRPSLSAREMLEFLFFTPLHFFLMQPPPKGVSFVLILDIGAISYLSAPGAEMENADREGKGAKKRFAEIKCSRGIPGGRD